MMAVYVFGIGLLLLACIIAGIMEGKDGK